MSQMSTSASMSTLHSAESRYSAFSGTPLCAAALGATATITTLRTQSRRSARPIQIDERSRMMTSKIGDCHEGAYSRPICDTLPHDSGPPNPSLEIERHHGEEGGGDSAACSREQRRREGAEARRAAGER